MRKPECENGQTIGKEGGSKQSRGSTVILNARQGRVVILVEHGRDGRVMASLGRAALESAGSWWTFVQQGLGRKG